MTAADVRVNTAELIVCYLFSVSCVVMLTSMTVDMIVRGPSWLAAHLDDPPTSSTLSLVVDLAWFVLLALVALTVRLPRERVAISVGVPSV